MDDKQLLIRLGKKIREIRKSKKISQMDLAYSVNMSMNTISYIELGKIAPKVDTLNKIANVLKVNILELFLFSNINIKPNNTKFDGIFKKLEQCDSKIINKISDIIDILND